MGQEIGVTPLQMCLAMSAIGNGGTLYRPYVVERITTADGRTKLENQPVAVGQPISAAAAATLVDIMTDVVTDGTARAAQIDGIDVAGKTGTAQKIVDGRYSHTKHYSSFVAFVPAKAPRLTIGVFVDEPVGKYYGGLVAAPTWKRVAEPLLRHIGISVGTGGSGESRSLGVPPRDVARIYLPDAPPNDKKKSEPAAPPSSPSEGPTFHVRAGPPAASGAVPDVVGHSLRDAVRLAWESGLTIRAVGDGSERNGIAVRQEPRPGSVLASDRSLTVYFEGG